MSSFGKRYKESVKESFDASAEHYERFEKKYHLFENLTVKLIEMMGGDEANRVLDVGCGTGISTFCLFKNYGTGCSYYGLDISDNMLDIARDKYSSYDNFIFVTGDAEHLHEHFLEKFDAIFYTASLFLIPDYRRSLKDARSLLNDKGRIAISFYGGLSERTGEDIIKQTYPDFSYKYGAFNIKDLMDFLLKEGLKSFTTEYLFQTDKSFLVDFFSIPAQASGLFPRQSYSRQLVLVREFLDDLFSINEEVFMKWIFIIIST